MFNFARCGAKKQPCSTVIINVRNNNTNNSNISSYLNKRHYSKYGDFRVPVAARASSLGDNVFAAFSQLALKHNSVNLGQGFPSFPCPDFLKEATCKAIQHDQNQYGRPGGNPDLVNLLAEIYSSKFNKKIDGMTEVVTYAGAQEGITAAAFAFVNPGDEVVVIEPYFDAYLNSVKLAGGTVKGVPLRRGKSKGGISSSADYKIDPVELENAISDKTKMIIINTPHNPLGKVFSLAELEQMRDIIAKHPNLLVLSDEVYEYSVFDDNEHIRFANLTGMENRTISMYSVGKTFSVTGWRLGYTFAPPDISKHLLKVRAALSFASVTPIEIGTYHAFKACESNNYYSEFRTTMQNKRNFLVNAMKNAGIPAIVPEGGYFTIGDTAQETLLNNVPRLPEDDNSDQNLLDRRDFRVARWLTTEAKITGIPVSCFYSENNRYMANDVLRFCHAKNDITMNEAKINFEKL